MPAATGESHIYVSIPVLEFRDGKPVEASAVKPWPIAHGLTRVQHSERIAWAKRVYGSQFQGAEFKVIK